MARAKVRGQWRAVSKAMARRFRARGIQVEDTATTAGDTSQPDNAGAANEAAPIEVASLLVIAAAPLPTEIEWRESDVRAVVDEQSFRDAAQALRSESSAVDAMDVASRAQGFVESEERAAQARAVVEATIPDQSSATAAPPAAPAEHIDTTPLADILPDVVGKLEAEALELVKGAPDMSVLPGGEIISDDDLLERMKAGPRTYGIMFEGSSNVRSAKLNPETGVVAVLFRNGQTVHYGAFTVDMMIEWEAAKSAGSWFHHNVRQKPDRHPILKAPAPSEE